MIDNNTEKPTILHANDGTEFHLDETFLRAGKVVIGRREVVPKLELVAALYDDWASRVKPEIERKAQKLRFKSPATLNDALLNEIVRVIVLELMRVRGGKREREGSAMNFANDNGVRKSVRRHVEALDRLNIADADAVAAYVLGMSDEQYLRYKKGDDFLAERF